MSFLETLAEQIKTFGRDPETKRCGIRYELTTVTMDKDTEAQILTDSITKKVVQIVYSERIENAKKHDNQDGQGHTGNSEACR